MYLGASKLTEITIGTNCEFYSARIMTGLKSRVFIGNHTTFNENLEIHTDTNSKVKIGNDCMFGRFVTILPHDGHAINDLKTGKRRNSMNDKDKPWQICIGKHVWVGQYVTILYPTQIGNGCVNGASSLVKQKNPIENNCMLAGNPAGVRRNAIAWSRDAMSETMQDCEEYI